MSLPSVSLQPYIRQAGEHQRLAYTGGHELAVILDAAITGGQLTVIDTHARRGDGRYPWLQHAPCAAGQPHRRYRLPADLPGAAIPGAPAGWPDAVLVGKQTRLTPRVCGAGRAGSDSSHAGHHSSVVASGCASPVSAATAAATSDRLART